MAKNMIFVFSVFASFTIAQTDAQDDTTRIYKGEEIVVSDFFIAIPSIFRSGFSVSDSAISGMHPIQWSEIFLANGIYVSDGSLIGAISPPRVAGADMARTNVLLDGIPVFFPQLGEFSIGWFPFGFARNVDILYGSYSSLYGSGGMGAVINIMTDHPRIAGAKTRLEFVQGDYSTDYLSGKMNYNLFERFSAVLWGDKFRNDGTLEGQHYESENLSARLAVNAGKNFNIGAFGLSYLGKTMLPSWGTISRQWDNHRIWRTEVEWNSKKASAKATLQLERYKQEYIYDINFPSSGNVHKADVLTFDIRGGAGLGFLAPISFLQMRKYSLSSTQSGDHDENSFAGGLYAPVEFDFANFFGSLRYDKDRVGKKGVSAGAGISKQLGDFKLLLSTGTGFRSPTPNDNYWSREGPFVLSVDTTGFVYDSITGDSIAITDTTWSLFRGNPETSPERSISGNLSINWKRELFEISVLGWATKYSDLIQWSPSQIGDTILWMPRNVSKAKIMGFQLRARYCDRFFDAQPTLTLLSAKDDTGRWLPGRAQVFASLPVEGRYRFWNNKLYFKLRFEPTYTDGIDTLVNPGADVPSFLLGGRVSIRYLALEIFAVGENLLDKQYRTISGQPARARNFRFGICWEFDN